MNFEDEHYVRIYTKDTKTWLRWGWEGQTVFMHLMRRLDKAGVLEDIEDPVPDVEPTPLTPGGSAYPFRGVVQPPFGVAHRGRSSSGPS